MKGTIFYSVLFLTLCIQVLAMPVENSGSTTNVSKSGEEVFDKEGHEKDLHGMEVIVNKSQVILRKVKRPPTGDQETLDQRLTPEQESILRQQQNGIPSRRKRKVSRWISRWNKNAPIYFYIDPEAGYSETSKKTIREATQHWEKVSCLEFRELQKTSSDKLYLKFFSGKGCFSFVGKIKNYGAQVISIGPGCATLGTVAHEIGHALGFVHEQNRQDRNSRVIINWENIHSNRRSAFVKYNTQLFAPYDYGSLMHYPSWGFAIDGTQTTIDTVDSRMSQLIGQRSALSFYDIKAANAFYECASHCGNKAPRCENEGFITKNCECHCPEGFKGDRCQKVETDHNCGGIIDIKEGTKEIVTSPNFPDYYHNNHNCRWLLRAPLGKTMRLSFTNFQVGELRGECSDSLEVRYHPIGMKGPRICGESEMMDLETHSHLAVLVFRTNDYDVRRGFRVEIEAQVAKDCSSSPCQNGGTCHSFGTSYTCECPEGVHGRNCMLRKTDGQWTAWSDWSSCSGAPCGVENRTRTCDNPAPALGGQGCQGRSAEQRPCSNQKKDLCQDYFECSFGTVKQPLSCGLGNESLAHGGWYVGRENKLTGKHLPPDHSDNSYAYVSSWKLRDNEAARIVLPTIKRSGHYCLSFDYFKRYDWTSPLRILKRRNSDELIYTAQATSRDWIKSAVDVDVTSGELLAIEGQSASYYVDTCIDNIILRPGHCSDRFRYTPAPTTIKTTQPTTTPTTPTTTRRTMEKGRNNWSCDFENGACPVEQDGDLRWSRRTGETKTWFTGPRGAAQGSHYMYLETSHCQEGQYAILYTSAMNDSDSVCVSFDYHMYGANINKLEVVTREPSREPTSVWSELGNHGDVWMKAVMSVTVRRGMTIGLKASCGDGDLGDICIDDLKVVSGECMGIEPPTTTPTPPDTTPQSSSVLWSCNFEEQGSRALCGAEQSTKDDFDWTVNEGRTPSEETGPDSAAKGRKYIYIETSKRPHFDEARLVTPGLPHNGQACLQLQYNMYGKWHIGTLEIIVRKPNGEQSVAWSETGNQGHRWRKLKQTLQLTNGAKMIIRGVMKDGHTGDIAVDDIWITSGQC